MHDSRPPRKNKLTRLDAALTDLLDSISREQVDPIGQLSVAWPEICGEPLGNASHPTSIRDGVLLVTADDQRWADALLAVRGPLLKRVQRRSPRIRTIKVEAEQQGADKASPAVQEKTEFPR